MLKKLVLLFAVLALVAAACSSDTSDDESTTTTEATSGGGDTGQATGESTLDVVKARGTLICGVSGSAAGFSETQADGTTTGFDAEYCRAIAAAVLGDADAVEFRPLTSTERFEALNSNAIDVLVRNTTWTQSRDAEIGMDFAPTTYFDGQQLLADPAVFPGLTENSTVSDIDGATVCVGQGTTTEKNISEAANVAGISITLELVEATPEGMEKFVAGTCDVFTTDGSGLYGQRAQFAAGGTPGAENWVIFPSTPISKEPLGPVTRQNDSVWSDVVRWTVYATFIFDEQGVTSANVDGMMDATPELTRLTGGEGEKQTAMGLNADAFLQVVKQVGNYGEIFDKTLTVPLGLERSGPNLQWLDGGLVYAPPAR